MTSPYVYSLMQGGSYAISTNVSKFVDSLGMVSAIVGTQWGDEGKGKAVDYLAHEFSIIARAQGGANAGHTITVGDKKHVFNLLPSGCLHEHADVILGSGMVIHLPTLLNEIHILKEEGIDITKRLYIAENAHIVFDVHKEVDGKQEAQKSKAGSEVGTTKRGIGPAYVDKMMRIGLRMEVLRKNKQELRKALEGVFLFKEDAESTPEHEMELLLPAQAILQDRIIDTVDYLHRAIGSKRRVLIEGAQAMLLDIDHGTYPYVTSSATTTAGALQGLGIAPRHLDGVIGVMKAYCTRVGKGDFPTEESGKTEQRLQENGHEFGATTGRRRRCGWLSLPDIARAIHVNGINHLCMTKLDVLDHESVIKVATDIRDDGTPTYKEFQGWETSTKGCTSFDELPERAKAYIEFIEKTLATPLSIIGTGPERDAIILR